MEILLLIVMLLLAAFMYWRGFLSGIGKVVKLELTQFPLNVTVHTENGIMYAYHMMNDTFIGQSANMDGLIEIIRKTYPEQTIVFSHNTPEVNK